MASEKGAASPAPTPNEGDGSKTAANVTVDQVAARLAGQAPKPTQTADTKATPAPEAEATSSPPNSEETAAEPTPTEGAAEPEASETPSEEDKKTPEGEEDEAVLSTETSTLDQKTKEQIKKRIDREVVKRKQAEGQIEQLKAQVQQLQARVQQAAPAAPQQPPVAAPQAPDPLPSIKDATALAEYKKLAKQAQREAEELLDRDDIDQGVQVGDQVRTKAEIKKMLREARMVLEDSIPQKEEYLRNQVLQEQQRQQATTIAHQKFPFLAEKDNADVGQATAFFQQNLPGVLSSPASQWFIGAYIKGIKAMVAEEQAAAKPAQTPPTEKPAPKAAPKPKPPGDQAAVSTAGTVSRLSPETAARSALGAAFEQLKAKRGVDADAAATFLAKQDQLRRQR